MSNDLTAPATGICSEHGSAVRPLLSLLTLALLFFGQSSPAVAAELTSAERQRDALRGITVWDSQVLVPDADNEVFFDEVRLELLSDGSTRVRYSGTLEAGETKNFASLVDRDAGTYSAMEIPASYVEELVEQSRKDGVSLDGPVDPVMDGAPGLVTPNLRTPGREVPGDNIEPPGGYRYCDYEVRGVISHYDPIFIPLATTTSTLRWRHDHGSNCLNRTWTNRTCWAAAVTPLGTHWFIQVCTSLDRNLSLQHLQKTTHGHYYNYDFGDPAQQTWIDHYIQIDARTGISTYLMADNDGGEYSALIFSIGSIGLTDLGCR